MTLAALLEFAITGLRAIGGLLMHGLDWLFKVIPPKAWNYIAVAVLGSVVGWQACYVFHGVPALKADRAALKAAIVRADGLQAAIDLGAKLAAAQADKDRTAAWKAGYDAAASFQAIAQSISPTILKVPYVISNEADAACPVPWGFVRLWDAYATGTDLDAVRARVAPGQPDDAKSDVSLSEIATLLGTAAVRFHQNADQLNRLEGFEREAGH